MYYYPVETRVTPLTVIKRERLLPARGEVLVGPGDVVSSADIVARCLLPGRIHVVDVSRALGLSRDRVAERLLKGEGDAVQTDEVLAAPQGPMARLKKSCRSPVDGVVLTVRDGLVLIEAAPVAYELRAHLKGQVTNIMPNLGVLISTEGMLIQGVWGSGGEAEGVLKMLVDNPQKPLRPRSIDVSCHGTVVVGGRLVDESALEQAVEAQVRGMVVGGVNANLRSKLQALPFPVIITGGFGTLPMAEKLFSLLEANKGREAIVSGDTHTRWDVKRPEIIIPLRSEEGLPGEKPAPLPLEIGMQVRVARAPHLDAIGTVTDLPPLAQPVNSGARMLVAEVDLDLEEPIQVPLANLEIIR